MGSAGAELGTTASLDAAAAAAMAGQPVAGRRVASVSAGFTSALPAKVAEARGERDLAACRPGATGATGLGRGERPRGFRVGGTGATPGAAARGAAVLAASATGAAKEGGAATGGAAEGAGRDKGVGLVI